MDNETLTVKGTLSWLSGNRRVCVKAASGVSAILSWLSSEMKCDSRVARPAYIGWLSTLLTWCLLIGPLDFLAPDQREGAVLLYYPCS